MRWPFRRKGDGTPAPEAAASQAGTDAMSAPAPRRSSHNWATLPPLPVTIEPSAPLVMGPAPVSQPLPGPRRWTGENIPPAAGRVEGLVHPIPIRPEPPVRSAEPPVPVAEPPLVHRQVHSGPATPVSSLTDAVGSYVGQAREPAEPYRAPAWLRYVPEWLQQGGTSEVDLGFGSEPVRRPEPPRPAPVTPRPAPVLPQRLSEEPAAKPEITGESTVDATSAPPSPARPKRRATLGQSRRLGLGAPLKRGPDQELILPAEQTQAPQAIEPAVTSVRAIEPAPVSGPPQPAEEGAEEAPEPPPAPPPQPPPLVHKPIADARPPADEPAEIKTDTVRPSLPLTGPVVPSVKPKVTPAQQEPVARATPLVFRSAPARPEQVTKPEPRRGTPVQVPTSLASAIRGSHGVDVGDVLVHRGPDASAEARSLGARAFTRDAEVFLPEEAGPLEAPRARGLLAHELVHVVQQRRLGTSLPASSTSAGIALEAEAVAVEHEHSGHSHAEPLVHPVLTQVLTQAARTAGVQLAPLVSEPISMPSVEAPPPPMLSTSDAVTMTDPVRQQVDQISQASATRVVEQWTNPALGGSGFASAPVTEPRALPAMPSSPAEPGSLAGTSAATEAEMASQVLNVINMDRVMKGEDALNVLDDRALEQIRQVVAEQTRGMSNRAMMMATSSAAATGAAMATEASTSLPVAPASAPAPAPAPAPVEEPQEPAPSIYFGQTDNTGGDERIDTDRLDLDDLSARLYDRLRSRLRLELLVDRERAGLLTDFR